ncbi:transcriptional repressor [Podochytrium sp. JEL0797]|nr:transcriptional repressor [Podochytrium sp. JEL0797]
MQLHRHLQQPQEMSSRESSAETEGTPKTRFYCRAEGCGKHYSTKGHLHRHNKEHLGLKSHACTVPGCARKFSRTDCAKQHILAHRRKLNLAAEFVENQVSNQLSAAFHKIKDPLNGLAFIAQQASPDFEHEIFARHTSTQYQDSSLPPPPLPPPLASTPPPYLVKSQPVLANLRMPYRISQRKLSLPSPSSPASHTRSAEQRRNTVAAITPIKQEKSAAISPPEDNKGSISFLVD